MCVCVCTVRARAGVVATRDVTRDAGATDKMGDANAFEMYVFDES